WPRSTARERPLLAASAGVGAVYVAYMALVDVPRYWLRWVADEAAGRPYLGLLQGFVDAATRRVVSTQWADWHGEMGWMTLYFSVAVWFSIALVHAPVPRGRAVAPQRRPLQPAARRAPAAGGR